MISRQNAAPDGFVRRRALLLLLYTRQNFCRTDSKSYVFLIGQIILLPRQLTDSPKRLNTVAAISQNPSLVP